MTALGRTTRIIKQPRKRSKSDTRRAALERRGRCLHLQPSRCRLCCWAEGSRGWGGWERKSWGGAGERRLAHRRWDNYILVSMLHEDLWNTYSVFHRTLSYSDKMDWSIPCAFNTSRERFSCCFCHSSPFYLNRSTLYHIVWSPFDLISLRTVHPVTSHHILSSYAPP